MTNESMRKKLAKALAEYPDQPVYFMVMEEDGIPSGDGIYGERFFEDALIYTDAEVCVADGRTFFTRWELREHLAKISPRRYDGDITWDVEQMANEAEFTPATVVYMDC